MNIIQLLLILIWIVSGIKRSNNLFSLQSLPIHIMKPRMCHHLIWSIIPQPILWLALDQMIHEIHCLLWPVTRNIFLTDLNLLCQDLVSDFLTISPYIWSEPKNTLKDYYSKRIIIHCHPMVASTHYLRRHIAWSSWGITWVLGLPNSGNT